MVEATFVKETPFSKPDLEIGVKIAPSERLNVRFTGATLPVMGETQYKVLESINVAADASSPNLHNIPKSITSVC